MSSTRFPGKVLAPFRDRPLIAHLLKRVSQALPPSQVVVATSREPADDPVASYVREIGFPVFRGPLDNVVRRFQLCLQEHPCTWFFRICADSPLLQPDLLRILMAHCHRLDLDLVTNVHPRTFPKGQSVEMLRAATFAALDSDRLTLEEQEHVTKYYYNHSGRFNLLNVASGNAALANKSFVIDTIADLRRLEKQTGDDPLLMECLQRLI